MADGGLLHSHHTVPSNQFISLPYTMASIHLVWSTLQRSLSGLHTTLTLFISATAARACHFTIQPWFHDWDMLSHAAG